MKKRWTIVLTLVLFINLLGINQIGANAKDESSWKQILQFQINHPTNAVGFINEANGITVGYHGECHYTTDGGQTWPRAENVSECRFGMDYINETNVWNCGNMSQVRRSDDGGRTWTAVSNCIIGNYIKFINIQTGWIANQTQLVATNDGGKSWNELKSPTKKIAAVSLLSETDGCILDSDNILYFTKDAGKSWRTQKSNIDGIIVWPYLRFFDANRAILIGFSRNQKKELVLTSFDGGKTWHSEIVADKLSRSYLSPDGKFLTLFDLNNIITVLQHQ